MTGRIRTGTASWTDPGFVAEWYPEDLPAGLRLRWYAEHFKLVEVNSTFYRIPEAAVVERWCQQTPEGFTFDVKLHRLLSRHSTKLALLPPALRNKARLKRQRVELTPALEKVVAKAFLRGIEPLAEARKLGALLLQLSPEFRPRHHELSELDDLAAVLEGHRLAVELRNRDWTTGERLEATRRFFNSRKLVFVMVDAPDDPHFTVMPGMDLVSNRELAYLRAHGRNASGYVRGRSVPERFDYVYSDEELKQIAARAAKAAEQAEEVHVIYNNNKADYAPRAATEFQNLIRKEFSGSPPARQKKQTAYA